MGDSLAILFIEDSEEDFALIQEALKCSGLQFDGRRVDERDSMLAALTNEHWDLVLSDYSLPGLYFPEILACIKKRWPSLPVILVSGTLGDTKAAVMVKLGASYFISKDHLSELAPAIRRHVRREPRSQ